MVKSVLTTIYEKGEIYFSSYEGIYCFGCERFYQERELVDGKCPDHGTVPETIKESNYFFKMSKYQEWLIEHIETDAVELGLSRLFCLTFEVEFFTRHGFNPMAEEIVAPEVYAQLALSPDEGVAEFLDLSRVKPNTLGNTRMLKQLS